MYRLVVTLFASLCAPLLAATFDLGVYAADCPKVVLVNNGSTSTSERAPIANFRFGRAVYLIPESELVANGLANGTSPTGIGWNYAVQPGVAASGSLKVYLENTTDTVNNKSTTWTTAIGSMTLVHSATTPLPATAGPWEIAFFGGSPFTYGGHGLYVAFDWQYPSGTLGNGSVLCSNALLGGQGGLKGAQSNTTAPTTTAISSLRPQTQLTVPATSNDASVDLVVAVGTLPEGLVDPQTVTALVTNNGGNTLSNLQATLTVAGANSFSDTTTITSLAACGGHTLVSFAPYTPLTFGPSSLGDSTVTVSVPADDVAANNSRSLPQSVSTNRYSYKYPGTTATGGTGFNVDTGELAARFSTTVETQVDAVTLEFAAPASGGKYRLAIRYDDGGGPPGSLLYADMTDRTVLAAGTVTVRLPTPVLVGPGNFFVGVQQTQTTNIGLSFDGENPIRPGVFYRLASPDLGNWHDFADVGLLTKLNLGVILGDCLVPLSVDVTPSGTSHACSGASIPFSTSATGGTGTLTYQWTEDGTDIPSATTSAYTATKGAPGSFAYNVSVTDDGGCVDVQDASSATGMWANPPTATVSGGGGICTGGLASIQADLTGTGPWNLVWSDGFNQNGVAASPASRIVSPAVNTTYTVTSVSDLGCSGSSAGSAPVTVNSSPSETGAGSTTGTILEWSSKTQLLWPANPNASSYKLYRGGRTDFSNLLTASADSCKKFEGNLTTTSDSSSLGGGELFWYLVTGKAGGCEGTAGNAVVSHSMVPRNVNDSGTCPP